jgi:trehalose 6-phosphate synthase/phosphatase
MRPAVSIRRREVIMKASKQETGRLVVVSNRLPLTLKRNGDEWETSRSSGGLATAMDPILSRTGGIWIGWPGDASGSDDEERQNILKDWREKENCIPVDLPPELIEGFYEGFSNQTLWFLFHHFPSMFKFSSAHWQDYVRANEIFRDAVLEHLQPGDLVWIHDYQLMLLPRLLREARPDARIGFFLHIPFPSSDVFCVLPRGEDVLKGLLGADYLAFHTHRYLQNFRSSLLRNMGVASQMDRVEIGGRSVRLEAQPIGIAPKQFTGLLDNPQTKGFIGDIAGRHDGLKILLGVDRLDFTKGIPERLRAYRRFLQIAPEMRGRVVFIQVAVPSRERIQMYKDLQQEVDELVGQINGEFGTADWTPLIYLRRNLPREELVALYASADVALVTALRDGLNLVAKEYVACQPEGDGVLMLSEFAGAAAEMGEALQVNPYDEERTAETIRRALNLSDGERKERMNALFRRVTQNDVFSWGERFIANLEEAVSQRAVHPAEKPEPLPVADIVEAFQAASGRLIMLDYDGTLVPFANRPQAAVPPPELIEMLERLAAQEATTVMVVSGRSRADLENWFGGVAHLWLAAEHGAIIRPPETLVWETSQPDDSAVWKKKIYPVLEHFAARTPGSFIEEKEFSLVWHYRMADPKFGEWLANELVSTLEGMLSDMELRAVQGHKTVEVKLMSASKAEVLKHLLKTGTDFEFIFAAGDDTTDEDLFAEMTPQMWTIHVGNNNSKAHFRLADFKEMRRLLQRFAGEKKDARSREARAR